VGHANVGHTPTQHLGITPSMYIYTMLTQNCKKVLR